MAAISSSGYSASEISSMQQDAIRRVREMQRRAQQRLEQSNQLAASTPSLSGNFSKASNSPSSGHPAQPLHNSASQAQSLPFQGILEKLGVDGETGLILILLLLLLNDGADRTLILALVYILVT